MQLYTAQSFAQRQSLVVTAQLQQAICLLQMPNAELSSFIETQSEENPFLELRLPPAPAPSSALPRSQAAAGDDWDRVAGLAADPGPSLYVHVTAEIARLGLTAEESAAASVFLDALEPWGWLGQPLELLAPRAGLSLEAAERLLAKLHRIEPAGLFARSLAECLRLQASEQGLLTPLFAAVLDHLSLLAAADLRGLCRACGCGMEELKAVLRQLRGLNPKPGALFDAAPSPQRPPDLLVSPGPDGWRVDLNRSTLPTVVVRADTAQDFAGSAAPYVGERLSVARWLARAVEHRNQTTLKIGAEVVRRQRGFLEEGPARMEPMTLREVADAVGVHESTVSRVSSGLMIATPQGTFPLKSFFTAALSAREGDTAGSAAAVRHRVRQLVQAESPDDPLSDDAIARIISDEGVTLARRTVAKYREQLNIPSSVQRRRQALVTGAL
ncbi:RNA polymerase factor sigma-54 [Cereibacter azotoformans]|uniref:RNA polymerase sigma-54 factor n=2 Tax=Cereibacter TaxID=1653176 RepID=A0A2T5KDG3_9RHOB|nr:RNA polymerase factor sigma-54 [Cereibacter azotoformans]AXQ93677.1 RNA polymerase sigma-54 factor [Cereibacter sphaeroides]MBO4168547.1 RNA polymerase factor sigma-54 [Cereibacter azotoformans]PTR20463.1 RNA polymerase RpoN-/SigL-like sigma 54 subunit [Cereibacter azotoformans]UIJ32019.1 RNA polymerase factor sigma-54 [Cereibacter azotoformans]ULB09853.1 RNA polymerase factor sigma-54 [Cereibacter azotoformans]